MKTHVLRISILALLVTASSYAQSSQPLHADVPFTFVAGGATLTAGEYQVDQSHPGLIILTKSLDTKTRVALQTSLVQRGAIQSSSTLVFHRYGGVYFLSQVWTCGEDRGRQAPITRRERLEARHSTPNQTSLAALR